MNPLWRPPVSNIIFPAKTKDRFIEVNNNVIRYYQLTKNTAYLKWQALTGDKASKQENLYFINRSLTQENGSLPDFYSYDIRRLSLDASYHFHGGMV
ncbi:hypothetical protein ACFSQ7_02695 [Paenibacillus rhizoplanae]